jgi:hypothetical protein
MKTLIGITLTLLLFVACKDNATVSSNDLAIEKTPTIEGTWELIMRYNYDNNKVVDSFTNDQSYHQIKMFTKNKIMWTRHLALDSSDWFGYGSYKLNGNNLSEILDYGSKTMQSAISNDTEFKFEIELSEKYLNAIQIDDDGNRFFSEKYIRIE